MDQQADIYGEASGREVADEEEVAVEGEQAEGQVVVDDMDMEGDQAEGPVDDDMESGSDIDEDQGQAEHEMYEGQAEGQQDRHLQDPGLRSGQMTVEPDVWMEDGTMGLRDVSAYNTYSEMLQY